MRFSVVIPAYNAPNLSNAIDSCLNQSLRPHEIIVVDDASGQLPAESLASRYSAECDSGLLKFINLTRNCGPSTARNAGWDAASGDYVAFLDADDWWHVTKLAVLKAFLDEDPTIDWLAHRYLLNNIVRTSSRSIFDCRLSLRESGATFAERKATLNPSLEDLRGTRAPNRPTQISLRRLLVANVAQTSCVVLRRSITHRFDKRMRHSEDYDLWLRIIASGHNCYVSDLELTELGRPQLTPGGLSANHWAMRRGEMLAYFHLSMLRPILASVLPFLLTYSLIKHFRKAISRNKSISDSRRRTRRRMYKALRQLANAVLPRKFLLQHEELIRWPYAVWFGGTKHRCNICRHWLRRFIELENGDSLCPFCGSSSRNRRLWQLMRPKEIEGRVLHFSPARPLYRRLKQLLGEGYVSTDFQCEFLADQSYDIACIPEPDNSFDMVICFHVLEHIEDDRAAVTELHRVSKPGGIAYIQTPFREGATYENPAITNPAARLEHFGQEDHVRVYSVSGLTQRLVNLGFVVSAVDGQQQEMCSLGLSKDEIILECKKRVGAEKVAA